MSRGLMVALISAVVVLALGVAGIAAYLFMMPKEAPAASAPASSSKKAVAEETAFLAMPSMTTDLVDRNRFLKLTVQFGLPDDVAKKKVEKFLPQLQDVVLTQARAMSAAELSGADGKAKMIKQIEDAIPEHLKSSIIRVYITEMAVQ